MLAIHWYRIILTATDEMPRIGQIQLAAARLKRVIAIVDVMRRHFIRIFGRQSLNHVDDQAIL